MVKVSRILRLFGVDIVVDGDDDHDNSLLLLEPEIDHQQEKYSQDDHHQTAENPFCATGGDHPMVYCPRPLRWHHPEITPHLDDDVNVNVNVDVELSLSHASSRLTSATGEEDHQEKSEKRERDEVCGENKIRRSTKRRRCDNKEDLVPIIPLEEIPGLVQTIEARNGSRPVFVYGKELQTSDVLRQQNRLFVNNTDKLMELVSAETLKKRTNVVGVDSNGNVYNLGLKIWGHQTIMNGDWNKMVTANNAEKGDWVQMWGYRENDELCFAINFTKKPHSSSNSNSDQGTSKILG